MKITAAQKRELLILKEWGNVTTNGYSLRHLVYMRLKEKGLVKNGRWYPNVFTLTNIGEEYVKQLLNKMSLQDNIIKFLQSHWSGGTVTEEIAAEFNLSNRQVGAIMGKLNRSGRVRTYTKGTLWIQHGLSANCAPTGLSNSYYEAI